MLFWASGDDHPPGAPSLGTRPAAPHVLSWEPRAWEPSRGKGLSHRGIRHSSGKEDAFTLFGLNSGKPGVSKKCMETKAYLKGTSPKQPG